MIETGSAWIPTPVGFGDTLASLIEVKYEGDEAIHTLAVDADGTASKLLVTLVTGTTTTELDGATYTTLSSLIDAINAVDDWSARRKHGASDLSTDSDDFIDETARSIPRTWTKALNRDASEYNVWTHRFGNPEIDDNGRIQFARIEGAITGTGTLSVKVFQDPSDSASDENRIWQYIGTITTATNTEFLALEHDEPFEVRGPIFVEVEAGTDLTDVDLNVVWRPKN